MKMEKKIMFQKVFVFSAFLAAGLYASASVCFAGGELQMQLAADTINITTFYNGTTLEVRGTAPAETDVVLEVSGPKQDVHLKEKGKVLGFLWMNKSDVTLENAPADYMIYTPENAGGDIIGLQTGIGYQSVGQDIIINPETEDRTFIFGEYVKLMEKAGVYAINQGAVTYGPVKGGIKPFSATLIIPSKMSAGKYQVKAFALQHGVVADQVQTDLTIQLQGFPAIISSMAFNRSLMFGVMAVVIAIAAGLLVGVLFKSGGGSH
jgi:uncharacterized protein (TIGR02186 family)